jgi:transposase-like protein
MGLSAEEIFEKLQRADALLRQGKKVAAVVKALGVTEVVYYRWRREYGGMLAAQARRLKVLERENRQLRKTVADLTLDKLILQKAAKEMF